MIKISQAVRVIMLLLAGFSPALAEAQDRIISFHGDIEIHADTTMTVKETIKVSAGKSDIKHGIFRDFPQIYKNEDGIIRKRSFELLDVTMDGAPVQYELEKLDLGTRVKIGSAKVYLFPRDYVYSITYKTSRQLGYFQDHDELYWNVTGNGWKFPIEKVVATVTLPAGATMGRAAAWTGDVGSTEQAATIETLDDGRVRVTSTRKLNAHEGMTFAVSWPKGHVDYAQDQDSFLKMLKDNPMLAVAGVILIVVSVWLFYGWWKVGRDPIKGTIIPRYEPPVGFSPAGVRYLRNMGADDTTFTAAVLGLAAKGALRIVSTTVSMEITKRKKPKDLLEDEETVYDKLFASKSKVEVASGNAVTFVAAKIALENQLSKLQQRVYFSLNNSYSFFAAVFAIVVLGLSTFVFPGVLLSLLALHVFAALLLVLVLAALRRKWNGGRRAWWMLIYSIAAFIFWLVSLAVLGGESSYVFAAMMVALEVMIAVFDYLIKAYTSVGRKALDEIEGFKLYLGVAEKDRLNLENPPERTPELFEKFLPFALALDVEQEWSEQFNEVLAAHTGSNAEGDGGSGVGTSYSPSYFTGDHSGLSAGLAATTAVIASTLGANLAAASVSPSNYSSGEGSSSSGGYSGGYSGGGGSSGGGGGGGVGGGW